jgi:hypothetical protein
MADPVPDPVADPGPAAGSGSGFPFGDFGTRRPLCPPRALRARPRRRQ